MEIEDHCRISRGNRLPELLIYRQHLIKVIHIALGIMVFLTITAFFLAENGKINNFPTYFVGVLFIVLLVLDRSLIRFVDLRMLSGTAGLLGYLVISALWSDNGGVTTLFLYLAYMTLIVSFIYSVLFLQARFAEFSRYFIWFTILAATVSVSISIQLNYAFPEFRPLPEDRLFAFGRLNNPVVSALSYGMVVVLALHMLIQGRDTIERALSGLCMVALLAGVVLTGTRSVWAGLLAAALYSIAFYLPGTRSRKLIASFALLLAVSGILLFIFGWEELARRSASFRPEIWLGLIEQTLSVNWLFGNGIASDSSFQFEMLEFQHAHSIYVSIFFYGGMVGLLALLGFIGLCADRSLRANSSDLQALASMMLLYGITVLFFDGDRILTKVDYIWIVFWLPIAMVLVADQENRNTIS